MKLFDREREYDLTNSTDALRNLVQSNSKLTKDVRHLLEKCWISYEPYVENNFLSDFFGKGFRQRCWELYFWHRLTDLGFSLSQPGSGMPDVEMIVDNQKIFVECMSPTAGEKENQIQVTNTNTTAQKVPEDKILLRITSSIYDKSKQAKKREEKVGNSPYIIAIDISQLKRWGFDEDYYFRPVYPIGKPIVNFDFESDDVSSQSKENHESVSTIKKSNNITVSTTPFLDGTEYSHISAILYCDADLTKITSFGNEKFTLVHNFTANNPLNSEAFKNHKQYFYREHGQLDLY